MTKVTGFVALALLLALGCGETDAGTAGSGGGGGTAGSGGGTAGAGGTPLPPPPPRVDQTCRDWCANEPEGPSCHLGSFESIQPCYEDCLRDYQEYEADQLCGDEWIAIKNCQLDLECADQFGDCDPVEDMFDECVRLANNRPYCEANCPQLDLAECEQDTTECMLVTAVGYCEAQCPTQNQQQCIQQYETSGTCSYESATSACRQNCTQQDLGQCVQEWLSGGRCDFNDGWTACDVYCPLNGNTRSECADHWDANGTCPPRPPPSCAATACIFCPVEALDPTVGALFPDGLLVPVAFTAEAGARAGSILNVLVAATIRVGPLPVSVGATLSGSSTTTYSASAGATGSFPIAVPEQELTGTNLQFDAEGSGNINIGGGATQVTIQMTEAVFDLLITDPLELPLALDASMNGDCEIFGDGVTIPVSAP